MPDIAIGGAGASVGGNVSTLAFGVPYKIPSGTRIAARIQSLITGGKTAVVNVWTFDMGDYNYAPTAVDVIGTSTATSTGTAMSGSSGTWVQITASTSNAYRAVVIVPSTSDASCASVIVEYRLGVGASGSEQEIGRTFVSFSNAEACSTLSRFSSIISGSIPSGSRLSIRHNIASSAGDHDITLIGIR